MQQARLSSCKLIICKSSGDWHHLLARRPVNILRNLSFSKGDYSKVRRQPSKKHWTKLHFTFLYTHYINQYTAKDTVGKEYEDLAANWLNKWKNPSPIQFLINLLTTQRNLCLGSLEHLLPLTVGRLWIITCGRRNLFRQARGFPKEFVGWNTVTSKNY